MAYPTLTIGRRTADIAVLTIGLMLIGYHGFAVWRNVFGASQHYIIHITGVLSFAALWLVRSGLAEGSPTTKRLDAFLGVVAFFGAVAGGWYFLANAETMEIMQPFVSDTALAFGCVVIATVLLLAWRIWGAVIAAICLSAALYMVFGHMLPEPFTSRRQPLNVAISFLSGIGGPRGVYSYAALSADMIFLLLIYGGALHATRVIDMFGDIGEAIGRRAQGGVAYSALVASTLIGMVTGQAVSNIALSGCMTIPSMKRDHFTAEQAGAIEVMASTGSQLLPPIMGLGAFLMAVVLGVSYIDIVIAALIPGLLYMCAILAGLYALISKRGARVEQTEGRSLDTTDANRILWTLPTFVISFAVLIALLAMRYSPAMAGFWGVALALGLAMLRPRRHRLTLKALIDGMGVGLNAAIQLAVVLAAIGLVVQTLTTTGVGVSAGRLIADLAGGDLLITLLTAMVVCLIVGMGLPTPAAYALIAIIVVPSLIDAGLGPLTANMFGFYFAIFSALTPPVAVGVLVACRISEGSFMGTAMESAKLGGVALLLPFLFVATPTVLDPANLTLAATVSIAAYVSATFLLAGAVYGALGSPVGPWARLGFLIVGPGSLVAFLSTGILVFGLASPIAVTVWRARRAISVAPQAAKARSG